LLETESVGLRLAAPERTTGPAWAADAGTARIEINTVTRRVTTNEVRRIRPPP